MQSVLWHLTFWIIFLWPKTDNYVVWRCWLVFFKKDELLLRRRKTICFFEEICLRIIFSHTEACAKMKNVSIFSPFLSIFHWLVQLNKKFIYSLYFMHFHYTVNQQDFLSLQRWYWLASRLWTRFNFSEPKSFRPRYDEMFQKKLLTAWSFLLSHRPKIFEQPTSATSIYSQPARDYWGAVWNTSKCASGYQVPDPEHIRFHSEDLDLNMVAVLRPFIDAYFSPSTFNDFEMGSMSQKPIPIDEEQNKMNCPPLPTTSVSERPQRCVDEKSALWNKNWECFRLCLQKFVLIISIYVTLLCLYFIRN